MIVVVLNSLLQLRERFPNMKTVKEEFKDAWELYHNISWERINAKINTVTYLLRYVERSVTSELCTSGYEPLVAIVDYSFDDGVISSVIFTCFFTCKVLNLDVGQSWSFNIHFISGNIVADIDEDTDNDEAYLKISQDIEQVLRNVMNKECPHG